LRRHDRFGQPAVAPYDPQGLTRLASSDVQYRAFAPHAQAQPARSCSIGTESIVLAGRNLLDVLDFRREAVDAA
jgi:hypothetical protein